MNTLLVAINAKYIHSNLAVYSLKAYAKSKGHHVDIGEYTINQNIETIIKDIYIRKPDLLGFSCYIWNIEYVKKIIPEVKKLLPDCYITLGGPEVSYNVNELLKELPQINEIISGEGEVAFCEVINKIENTLYNNNAVTSNITNETITYIDMDTLPFPYENIFAMDNRIIYYESSRGCPYLCSYCLSCVDRKVRFRSLDKVFSELKIFINNKVPQVKFVDRTFNCNRERTIKLWKFLMENDNGITNFHFEISADLINEEEIALLNQMRPGLVQLEIGVQTTNEKTLDAINRHADFEKISSVVKAIKGKGNIHQHLDLIAGLPYEDFTSFKNSFNDVFALEPDQLQLGFLKVLHGSPMKEFADNNDIKYLSYPPYEVISTPWLSYDDILKLKGIEEAVEIYYNSRQFIATLAYLRRFFTTPFDMFEHIANYYESKKLTDIGHSRIKRYEILLDMFCKDYVDKSILKQTISYDLYHRENLKNRPEFLPNIDEHKKLIHSLYLDEVKIRNLLPEYEMYTTKQIEKMTNTLPFSINIGMLIKTGKIIPEENYILFDYLNKDKLNGNASIIKLNSL